MIRYYPEFQTIPEVQTLWSLILETIPDCENFLISNVPENIRCENFLISHFPENTSHFFQENIRCENFLISHFPENIRCENFLRKWICAWHLERFHGYSCQNRYVDRFLKQNCNYKGRLYLMRVLYSLSLRLRKLNRKK